MRRIPPGPAVAPERDAAGGDSHPAVAPGRPGACDDLAVPGRERHLAAVIGATHEAVAGDLAGAGPDAGFTAIARLSAHLAAMRRAVCPAARRQPGAPRQLLATFLARGREVDWALRLLECRLSGDMFAMKFGVDAVYAGLQHHLGAYRPAEQALVAWMHRQLPARDRDLLAVRYRAALAHAPTRPHPRGPRAGVLYRVAFGLHGFWDRLLDAVDSRPGMPALPPVSPGGVPGVTPPARQLGATL
jgi:hypothetical protein